jgi:inner membrane protein
MASLGHVAVGMALGRVHAGAAPTRHLALTLTAFAILAMLPDVDVVAFRLGIPYAAPWGHRGAAHAMLIALALGAGVGLWARSLRLAMLAMAATVSHALLDTLTDGGLGVALLWPFSLTRFFAPWRPLPVAPIGRGFVSAEGLRCVVVELVLFAPFWLFALWPRRR